MNKLTLTKEYIIELLCLINRLNPHKKLVIVLDSIDQLNINDHELEWFIKYLPTNVKMIYSTQSNDILKRLMSIFKTSTNLSNLIEIKSLDKETAKLILKDWLSRSNRNLNEAQWKTVENMFDKASLYPLYVKLIFDVVVKWASFYVPEDDFKSCLSINDCIVYLFKRLEKIHGKSLFSRAMIYMSSFKNGVAESEIEDILSLGKFFLIFRGFRFSVSVVDRCWLVIFNFENKIQLFIGIY
jgi:hypothetical protein